MAAFQGFDPGSGDGIVVLANAQAIPYELLGKIDMIGFGALDLMLGREPNGTLEKFYVLVDIALIVALVVMLRGHLRLARPGAPSPAPDGRRSISAPGGDHVPRLSRPARPDRPAAPSAHSVRRSVAGPRPHRHRSRARGLHRSPVDRWCAATDGLVAHRATPGLDHGRRRGSAGRGGGLG